MRFSRPCKGDRRDDADRLVSTELRADWWLFISTMAQRVVRHTLARATKAIWQADTN